MYKTPVTGHCFLLNTENMSTLKLTLGLMRIDVYAIERKLPKKKKITVTNRDSYMQLQYVCFYPFAQILRQGQSVLYANKNLRT